MKKFVSLLLAAFFLVQPLIAQQPLPIRRILLYKNGMAYIVRAGEIRAALSLTFRPDEMNDVLKTFTAWNPDTSALYPVGYTTGIAADHLLQRFPFDLRSPSSGLAAFLLQIKGAVLKLDLGNGKSASGQRLAVVEEDRAVQQQTVVKDHRVTILGGGSVESMWLSDVRSLELEDPALGNELKSYLQVLSEGRQDVTREVTVYPTAGAGPVNVAYVQQFPIWKTTYRVDLDKDASRIQGWSQIDNPTGESWDNVDLTLVSGMPTSFTMNLYEPLYATRQTVSVPSTVVAAPRRYDPALDTIAAPNKPNTIYGVVRDVSGAKIAGVRIMARMVSDNSRSFSAVTDETGYFEIGNLAPGSFDLSASLPGFMTFTQRVQLASEGQSAVMPVMNVAFSAETATGTGSAFGGGGRGGAPPSAGVAGGVRGGVIGGVLSGVLKSEPAAGAPALQPPFNAAGQTADASHNEDYFEYRFPFPIQLGSRQSALLPFLNKPIKAERVSIYKGGADRDHPLNGAWIENNSELPLEPGPVTFFQKGQYAGETVIDYLSRDEKRLVSYGVDYDIQAETRQPMPRPDTIAGVTVSRGFMIAHYESTRTTSYRFRNKGQDAKTIVLEHPRNSQTVLKDAKPDETSASAYRFRISLAPGQEIEFPVVETVSHQTNYNIRSLDRVNFDLSFSGSEFPEALRTKIHDIMTQRERLADLQAQKTPIDDSIKAIFTDQDRLRENIKALGNRSEDRALRQKYLAQLDSQEQQVKDLRAKLDDLTRQIAVQDALVSKLISELNWN